MQGGASAPPSSKDKSSWATFGEKLCAGLDAEDIAAVKEYLQEYEIKKTDKQLKPFSIRPRGLERRKMMEAAKAVEPNDKPSMAQRE